MILFDLFEARQKHPEISYVEQKLKGVVTKVVAVLSGNKSGAFTRLAQRYKRMDRLAKLMAKERQALNKDVKEKVRPLFDAQDAALTRVVETASLIITLSKAQSGTSEYLDIEGYVEALEKLMPGMEKQIEALRKQYTVVEKFSKDESIRVRLKEDESDELENYAERAADIINAYGFELDAQLKHIKQEMASDGLI